MQSKLRKFIGPLALLGFIITILGSAPSKKTQTVSYKPGWYGVSIGWNDWKSDIDGQIGYPLYVSPPGAFCRPSLKWTSNTSIVSGTLPPGIAFKEGSGSALSGTPTERGHWIVKLRLSNIQCEGSYYKDFEQELRFHITGSGKVNN